MSLLQTIVERSSESIAFATSDVLVSYRKLLDSVKERARQLRSSGVGGGDRFVWCPKNDLDTLATFWSLFELGAVACPISPRFPEASQQQIKEQLGCETDFGPVSPATIILSSGSTGTPKAIVHELEAHTASARGAATNIPLAAGDRWLWSLPAYHVSGLSILFRCALAGATVYGTDASTRLSTDLLRAAKITHLSVVGTQLRRLIAEKSFPQASLRAVLLGGSANPSSLVDEARNRGVPVHTTYGLTETASQVTTSKIDEAPESSGRVLPQRELKVDENGEILVRGETMFAGYLRDGVMQSALDKDGWFHTGDTGSLRNGLLHVTGRRDNMFVSGGENIYPETIERVLLSLPNVEQAIVVPRPDDEFGSRPVAFIRGDLSTAGGWEESLTEKLRSFEIPVAFLPWPEDANTGIKPNRKKLQALAAG